MSAEPGHHRLRAAILTYHAIDESGSVLSTSPGLFTQQMQILAESGVRVVPLTENTPSADSDTCGCAGRGIDVR
jgi:hypothetical protein